MNEILTKRFDTMVSIPAGELDAIKAELAQYKEREQKRRDEIERAENAGQYEVNGVIRMDDAKRRGWPIDDIRAHDVLADQAVRKIIYFGEELSSQVARFKGHTFQDMGNLQSLLEQDYGIKAGGEKGNLSFSTYDGSQKVEIKVAELQEFGPEIDIAQKLFTDCVTQWAENADARIIAVIERAFSTDGGTYNRNELLSLLRLDIDDEKWRLAQQALTRAIRVVGTKSRIYLKKRNSTDGKWETVVISLANS